MGITHALNTGSRRGLVATAVAGVLAISGLTLIGYAVVNQDRPPQPDLSVAPASPTATPTETVVATPTETNGEDPFAQPTPTDLPTVKSSPKPAVTADPPKAKTAGRVMAASKPVSLSIPAIGVQSPLLHTGLTAQSTLEVPAPGPDYDKAAWYRNSPTPGSLGPAVIVGHIDSKANGPSVFYKLGSLRKNDKVRIARADGSVAVFAVNEVRRFEKKQFPTWLVYGNTDHAALRIITCGGPFDRDTGSYRDNIIVLASLSS